MTVSHKQSLRMLRKAQRRCRRTGFFGTQKGVDKNARDRIVWWVKERIKADEREDVPSGEAAHAP